MTIEHINTQLLTRGPLRVRIIKVEAPTFFWVQTENGREDFEELLEDLSRRMSKKGRLLHHRTDSIRLDDLVAIREGTHWQRGIVAQIERSDVVTVLLRDWGRFVQRSISECYILEERFHTIPWRAIPCGLANIKPVGTLSRWPHKVNKLVQLLAEKREAWIRIRATYRDEAAAVDVKPKRQHEEELDDLKQLLILTGCAEHCDQRMFGEAPQNRQ